MTGYDAVDLFAGPGGWDVAARELGLDVCGVELDDAACRTRAVVGLPTVKGDVAALDPQMFAGVSGLIASPPCQAWSSAGKRGGEVDKHKVFELCEAWATREGDQDRDAVDWEDERSPLAAEPIRWARELQPMWMAWEQVPPVLELWKWCAALLRDMGYHVWTGILSAERYGVPQTRRRAILLAHRDRPVAPPAATHQEWVKGEPARQEDRLDGTVLPWVSIERALGWVDDTGAELCVDRSGDRAHESYPANAPAPTITARSRRWYFDRRQTGGDGTPVGLRPVSEPAPTLGAQGLAKGRDVWRLRSAQSIDGGERAERRQDEPAITITSSQRSAQWADADDVMVPLSIEEAAVLQAFPADYPFQGSRTKQFEQAGNAIPPYLARAVLGQVAEPATKAEAA